MGILKRGFSLVEILIVIGLAGTLIAVMTVSYNTVQKQARDQKRLGDMRDIQKALEQYYLENGKYPTVTYDDPTLSAYFPGGTPTDPLLPNCKYKQTVYTEDAYTICADMENDGFTCKSTDCDACTCSFTITQRQ